MAEEGRSTPEKQLLKILEGEKAKGAPARGAAVKRKGLSFFSAGAWRGRFSFLRNKGAGRQIKAEGVQQLDIKAVNRILVLTILGLFAYLGYTLYASIINMREMPNLRFDAKESVKAASFPEASPLRALTYYTEKVLERSIFKMGVREFEPEEEPVRAPSFDAIAEATGHLRLVGISWSDNPDAMIEDTDAVRTFFVKRGQMIGPVKVQAIFKDKVVLSFEGAEIELK